MKTVRRKIIKKRSPILNKLMSLKPFNKNKKGDAASLLVMVIMLFVLGIAAVLFSHFFLDTMEAMKDIDGISNNTINSITTVENQTIPLLDYLFLFTFIGILIAIVISSIFIDSHPAVIFIFIILLAIAIMVAAIFSNAFDEIGNQEELAPTYNQFSMTRNLMNIYPLLILVAGIISGIIN